MKSRIALNKFPQALLCVLAIVALCGFAPAAHAQTTVRVAASSGAEITPLFVAIDNGIFVKHGLDVKANLFPSGIEAINSLAGGSADVGVFGTYPLLAAVSKGIPLVLIGHNWGNALARSQSEYFSLISTKSSGVQTGDLTSLKGRKIGVAFGSGANAYVNALFQQAGIKEGEVKLINVPAPNQPTALANGDVDVIASWEPIASKAVATVSNAVRVMHGGAESFYEAGCLVTTEKTRDEKLDMLTQFLIAYAEAGQWIRGHRAEAAAIAARWLPGISTQVLVEALKYIPQDLRLSKNTINGYRNLSIPLMIADGRIKKPLDPESFIDGRANAAAQKKTPQFFSDLKPIPDDLRLAE